ncbi:MAG: TlpA family protein disulfide reductase [candidate division WOR-3 bacterium]|nr:MAG: TlpA family protein disulfide reductase [candidate division WOR-3 bacterium]
MISSRIICVLIIMAVQVEFGLSQVNPQTTTNLFEYSLTPGKKLFYTARSRLDYSGGTLESTETLEIWVLKQNNDRSWQILLHNSESSVNVDSKGTKEELPAKSSWGFCDFLPTGRFERNRSVDNLSRFDLYLPNIFIPLPNDFSQTSLAWEYADHVFGEKDRYTASKPATEERSWIVRVDHQTPLDAILLLGEEAEVYIDLLKAIPVYMKRTSTRGYGYYAGKGTTTAILDSIVDLDTLQASRFARDLAALLTADSQYSEIIYEIETNPAQLIPLRQEAGKLYDRLRTQITTADIRNQLNERIVSLPDDFEDLTEQITNRAKIVNKPAPKWRAEDFSGQQHSSEDKKGRIVLLDFWYRACPWCIRSMPMIEEVARYFKDKPVSVLGVNTDREQADALFVIERTNPPYVNIRGRNLIKKFDITSYPTFIIIDKNGLVRSVLIGYEPKLSDRIIGIIENLL